MPKPSRDSGALFEVDYLVRTLGRIAHDPDVALTELVANAWDAGAYNVDLLIPPQRESALTVMDDGHGMTADQFKKRWMTLGYNRVRHQGASVEFPPDREAATRRAYGRNGVGRHGLLCFADEYDVETWRDGKGTKFTIATNRSESPFSISKEVPFVRTGHGTKLSVNVDRHLPDSQHIAAVLSARFLHDPQFVVKVNGVSVPVSQHSGLRERKQLLIDGLTVDAFVVDSTRAARLAAYQGIAFWVNNRLVGTPSWAVGSTVILDGRGRFAKQYTIVVRAGSEWITEVEEDWTRFKSSERVEKLYSAVCEYALQVFQKLSAVLAEENSQEALLKNREGFKTLSRKGRLEVATFAHELVRAQPTIQPEALSAAVQGVISLEKSRSGASLLDKLVRLDERDIEGLDRLLGQWTVTDALSVLDEIDRRLSVIAAIDKLAGDTTTDELHTLHPLVTQARWLFGPEYDSPEYSSNQSLRNAVAKIFNKTSDASAFVNASQRPDLVILANATLSVVATESFDTPDSPLIRMNDILVIELKKGRSSIGRDEMNQAQSYVQDFLFSGALETVPYVRAYVVGHEVRSKTSTHLEVGDGNQKGRVVACTYSQLTRTGHQRLFRLKEKIPARYDDLSGMDLVSRIMEAPTQAELLPSASTA